MTAISHLILVLWGATLFFLVYQIIRVARKKTTCLHRPFLRCVSSSSLFFVNPFIMKKISSLVSWFVISLVAMALSGINAAIDGAIVVVSSDPDVLRVTPLGDGKFHVEVIGVGNATLTVSGDADLGDGIKPLSQDFAFEVYDGATEADHFELQITEIALAILPVSDVQQADPAIDTSATDTATG